ncbi:MAG: NUDIX domain-containing protein [Parcubacteria group bacterium]|nr:NUDIX domain-containing protein [Parcubacteria group bacterium]
MEEKDTYFVAVKLFLEDDGKLFIFKDKWGDWDLPGGRIKKDEFNAPLEEVIARKVKEELGEGVIYTLGKPEVLMRHERV